MHRTIIFILSALLLTPIGHAAPANTDALNRVTSKLSSMQSIVAKFTIRTDEGSQRGTITADGNGFVFETPTVSSWFDGKDQWTYSSQTQEVNITQPTDEELMQINPFSFLRNSDRLFTVITSKSSGSLTTLLLKPKAGNDSQIKEISLVIRTADSMPSIITLKFTSGQSIDIDFSTIADGGKLSSNIFKFPKAKYPDVEIVDLR